MVLIFPANEKSSFVSFRSAQCVYIFVVFLNRNYNYVFFEDPRNSFNLLSLHYKYRYFL